MRSEQWPTRQSWETTPPGRLFIARTGTERPVRPSGPWPDGWQFAGHHRAQFVSVYETGDPWPTFTARRILLCIDAEIVYALPGCNIGPVAFGFDTDQARTIIPFARASGRYQYTDGLSVQVFDLETETDDVAFLMLTPQRKKDPPR